MVNDILSIWHQGELTVQRRAGTDIKMSEIGPKFIREFMPQQHRDFFQSLTMLFIGYSDTNSTPCASVLFGEVNFIESPTNNELVINTQYSLGDFIHQNLTVGDRIGLLGLEFSTRRRNRVNAIITDINQKSIKVKVLQSYGNCPKYIQTKAFKPNVNYGIFSHHSSKQLSQVDQPLIREADAFFIASSFDDGKALNNRGTDISHRGGEPNFVTISHDNKLLIDDYVGNGFFNTLGNLLENPIANLLFFDWNNGHALKITATSEILWNENEENTPVDHISSVNINPLKNPRTLCFTLIKIERLTNALAYLQV